MLSFYPVLLAPVPRNQCILKFQHAFSPYKVSSEVVHCVFQHYSLWSDFLLAELWEFSMDHFLTSSYPQAIKSYEQINGPSTHDTPSHLQEHIGSHPPDIQVCIGMWRILVCCSRRHQGDIGWAGIHPHLQNSHRPRDHEIASRICGWYNNLIHALKSIWICF